MKVAQKRKRCQIKSELGYDRAEWSETGFTTLVIDSQDLSTTLFEDRDKYFESMASNFLIAR